MSDTGGDFRRLRYFKAVAEELHFRRAAETLKVAQPALSRQIHDLERDLGVRLFERGRRRIELTSAGIELLAGVRTLLEVFETATERAREAHDGGRGVLTIGSVGMVMVRHLPSVVRLFRSQYSGVAIDISVHRSAEVLEALRRGRVQLAFATGFEAEEGIVGTPLWAFAPRVVLPRDHPLANEAILHLNRLDGETLFIHHRHAYAYREVMALCAEQRFTPGAIKEVGQIADLETLIGLVGCGLGVAILPSPLEEIIFPSVVFKPIATKQATITICWRSNDLNPLVHNFARCATGSLSGPAVE